MRKKKVRRARDPRPYLIRTNKGFAAVLEGVTLKEITDKVGKDKIQEQLDKRRTAGETLTKLVQAHGVTIASVHNATKTLGAGD